MASVYVACIQSAVSQVIGQPMDWNRVRSVRQAVIRASLVLQTALSVHHTDHTR